jgi:zinc D-Ala-D-Ala dipeptidase
LQRCYRAPDQAGVVSRVLLSDRRIAAVSVVECGEPLVDLRTVPGIDLDGRQADPAGAYARLRVGALHRLFSAQRCLPPGWRLVVVEAYRPLELQTQYYAEYLQLLEQRYPTLSARQLRVKASRYIAPPEVAPHVTGGAVDITLRGRDGRLAWMGTEVNDSPEATDAACYTDATNLSPGARRNRDLLCLALTAAGLVNYPTEWWHWSYGDRYWAFVTGVAARYGVIESIDDRDAPSGIL